MRKMIVVEQIEQKIYFLRGMRVMLDHDLAPLYGIEVKYLKRAVRRNLSRFPNDFMVELTKQEHDSLRCQFGTLERGRYAKYPPYAFTEQGVAMLSSVLNNERAIQVNIAIMRAFVKLREILLTHKDLARKIDTLEKRYQEHDERFKVVFAAIKKLLESPQEPKKKKPLIGFHIR